VDAISAAFFASLDSVFYRRQRLGSAPYGCLYSGKAVTPEEDSGGTGSNNFFGGKE